MGESKDAHKDSITIPYQMDAHYGMIALLVQWMIVHMNRQKNINRYSLKRIAEINAEVPIRLSLCNRVGGTPIIKDQTVKRHNEIFIIKRVFCVGGTCEVCDKPATT